MLLAIDPGRDTGWAEFTANRKLYACGLGDPRMTRPSGAIPEQVVIEKPRIYPTARSKGDPNDIITLAISIGRYAEYYADRGATVELVWPYEWKQQLPKSVCAARVYAALDTKEQLIVDAAGKQMAQAKVHNMMDAIGIGLYFLGRLRSGMKPVSHP